MTPHGIVATRATLAWLEETAVAIRSDLIDIEAAAARIESRLRDIEARVGAAEDAADAGRRKSAENAGIGAASAAPIALP